jgi:hypothetical protein
MRSFSDWAIDAKMLPRIAVETVPDEPLADPHGTLEKQLHKAREKASGIRTTYEPAMRRSGDLAEQTQTKLEGEYDRQRDEVTKLERQMAALKPAPAIEEVQHVIDSVLGDALAGDVPARTKLAQALPSVVNRLTCRKDGSLRLTWQGASKITWTTALA